MRIELLLFAWDIRVVSCRRSVDFQLRTDECCKRCAAMEHYLETNPDGVAVYNCGPRTLRNEDDLLNDDRFATVL